jgi:Uncharacterized conserved protein (DUF2203)
MFVGMLHRHHYTVEQANAALPAVGRTVRRVRDARRLLLSRGYDTDFTEHSENSGGAWPGREHAEAALEVALGFRVLEALDLVVRDLERGLIDFPSLRDGAEVYLCWIDGEDDIAFWHELDAGYAGRQPL